MSYPYWRCEHLDQRMPYPHYSDETWNTYRLVYGAPAVLKTRRVERETDEHWFDAFGQFNRDYRRTRTVDEVYFAPAGPCESADSDRLWEWDYKRAQAAWASVPESERNTPRGVQTYLSAYWDRPVRLLAIHAITNRATGYTVWSYAWEWEVTQ